VSSFVIKHHGLLFSFILSTVISATFFCVCHPVILHSFSFILLAFFLSFIISNPEPEFSCRSLVRWLLSTTRTPAVVYLASMFLLNLQDLRQPVDVAELTNMMTC
jgi:hypothetical protein